MTNNDNCIRTLLNTSLASKSPKIFPMGHTREIYMDIFTPIYIYTDFESPKFGSGWDPGYAGRRRPPGPLRASNC